MAFETTDIFSKCAPALRTNIEECGTVSLCTASKPETAADLDTIYTDDGDYRVLGAMIATAMEIKQCGIVQNSWEMFFMANMRNMRHKLQPDSLTNEIQAVKPFILADQKHPINNVYWRLSNGASAPSSNWQFDLQSNSGIPSDARSFPAGSRIYVQSQSSGQMNIWSGVIVSSEVVGDVVHVVATPQVALTEFDSAHNPTTGIVVRGSANVARVEQFCNDEPGYINNNAVPFWIERIQETICTSDRYREWQTAIVNNNPLYKKYFNLPEVERNRQILKAFASKMFNNVMWGSPISANQTVSNYTSLPQVQNYLSPTGLGPFGGTCAGFKANTIGWMQQLAGCGQIYDALGDTLDLWSLMDAIYLLSRVRMGIGSAAAKQFDIFTDAATASLIDLGFIRLFKDYSADTMRLNVEIESGTNQEFGFFFRRYRLVGRAAGITLNVITHVGLDDYLSEWNNYASQISTPSAANGGRMLWLLDMTGMYIGMIESNRITRSTGDINDLVKVDQNWLCVEDAPKKETTLVSAMYAAVLECPQADLIVWNFANEIPVYAQAGDHPNYLINSNLYYQS